MSSLPVESQVEPEGEGVMPLLFTLSMGYSVIRMATRFQIVVLHK